MRAINSTQLPPLRAGLGTTRRGGRGIGGLMGRSAIDWAAVSLTGPDNGVKRYEELTAGCLRELLDGVPPSTRVVVFSTMSGDAVMSHRVVQVHDGWFFRKSGDTVCIEVDRSKTLIDDAVFGEPIKLRDVDAAPHEWPDLEQQ